MCKKLSLVSNYDGSMLVAEYLMTLIIGGEITSGVTGGSGTNIFTEANVADQ